jgi:hypothetical protein
MASPREQFDHTLRDGVQALKLIRSDTDIELKSEASQSDAVPSHRVLLEEYRDTIHGVIEGFSVPGAEPEEVFRAGMKSLARLEDLRFLLCNLLEAIKRDDSLQNSLARYQVLGLLSKESEGVDLPEEVRQSEYRSNNGSGRLLRRLWQRLRKAALYVMEIVANAIKVIPKLMSIRPKPSIGLAGPFPTFDLQFELEAESITIHELFHDLAESIEW